MDISYQLASYLIVKFVSELELSRKFHGIELINLIMEGISNKYRDSYNILLIDEIMSTKVNEEFNIADWSALNTSLSNVDFLVAMNPQGNTFDAEFTIVPPKCTNTLSCQLLAKHRNGYEIGILLEHLKHSDFRSSFYLDTSQDLGLDPSKLPNSRLPIWIQRSIYVHDEEVLELIKSDHIFPHESVSLLYHINHPLNENVKEWCEKNHWKHFKSVSMIGCEDQCMVLFDCNIMYEFVSRARNQVVIVTTQGFAFLYIFI